MVKKQGSASKCSTGWSTLYWCPAQRHFHGPFTLLVVKANCVATKGAYTNREGQLPQRDFHQPAKANCRKTTYTNPRRPTAAKGLTPAREGQLPQRDLHQPRIRTAAKGLTSKSTRSAPLCPVRCNLAGDSVRSSGGAVRRPLPACAVR